MHLTWGLLSAVPRTLLCLVSWQADVMQQHCDLEQLMGELDHGFDHRSDAVIARQFAQSQSDVVQADTRVAAVHDCIQELVELERFITQTKPPTEEAVVLTVREKGRVLPCTVLQNDLPLSHLALPSLAITCPHWASHQTSCA